MKKILRDIAGITLGSLLVALALNFFLVPNRIAAGGISGLATVFFHLLGLPVGITIVLFNIPLFLAGVKVLGVRFGIRSLYGMLVVAVLVDVLAPFVQPLTHEPLLASIYGGIMVGLGIGIVFRSKGTTGGTDLAARLISHFFSITVGQALLLSDFFVIALAGVVFGAELALIALLSLLITSRVIDLVQEGLSYAKAALIISSHPEAIKEVILTELNRGATALKGRGLYTQQDREVVLSVVTKSEITRLKEIIREADPLAFVIITDVHEVMGEGFERRLWLP